MTLSMPEHISDVVFLGSAWQIKTCRICRQTTFAGTVNHDTCRICQNLIDRGYDRRAIADQTAARIGFIAIRDGLDPQRGGVALGWDSRWHFISD